MLNLSVITIDRYIAIFHSFKYEELVTNSRVVKLLIFLWSSWIIIFVFIKTLRLNVKRFIAVLIGSNIIFICISYFKIFREIRRLEANVVVPGNEPEEVKKSRERKSAITTAYIIGLLLVCFLPKVLLGLVVPSFQGTIDLFIVRKQFLVSTTLALSNSSLNVLVYGWKNSEMKVAMLKVIRAVTQKFSNEVNP